MNNYQCNQKTSQNDIYLFTIKIIVGDRNEMKES